MNNDQKIDKLLDIQNQHGIVLAKIETDLRHHIKRSDQHEEHLKSQDAKIQRIIYLLIAGAAAGISEYGASILKYIGGLL